MPVLGAVATLSKDPGLSATAVELLSSYPELELGLLRGSRLPLVIDTPHRAADKAVWQRIRRSPGVLDLAVVFADFSDAHEHVE